MTLTEEQIAYIANNLELYGVASGELREDLLDHICTFIETGDFTDFDEAYAKAMEQFGGHHAMSSIQRETYLQVDFRKALRRKRTLLILGLAASMLFMTGVLFKVFHWPGAMILLGLGFLVVILLLLPLYFWQRYKSTERRLYE
jgi:hypothetical protein